MSNTLIAHGSAYSSDGNSCTTAEFDCRGANFIAVSISDYDAATHATVADFLSSVASGNVWSSSITPKDDGSLGYIQTFYINNPNVGQFQKFRAVSTGGFPAIFFQAWDIGSGNVAVLDQQNQGALLVTTGINTGSITPANSTTLIICACAAYFASVSITLDSPFTLSDYAINNGNNVGGAMGYKDGGSGPYNPSFNWTSTSSAAAHIASFKIVNPTGAGSAAATSTALAVGMATFNAVGSASESSTCTATGRATAAAVGGAAAATSSAPAVGAALAAGVGSASATSSASGANFSVSHIVGHASSTSSALAQSIEYRVRNARLVEYIPLIEIEFDSGVQRWAMDGSDTPDAFYSKRVQSIGSIDREVPRLCGLFTISSVSFVCFNTDQYLSRLRATEAWRGRRVTILFGDAYGSIAAFEEAYTGVIADWDFADDLCTITIEDNSLDRFAVPVTKTLRRLTAGSYPDTVPANAQPYLIPWAMGPIQPPSGGNNGGQLPAFLINAATFAYVACHEDLMTIDQVYVYGVLKTVTVDYVVDTFTATGGEVFTRITFTAAAQDLVNHTIDEVEVTWCGHTTEGNPIVEFQYFLETRADVAFFEFHSSWDDIIAEFSDREYRGTLVVTKADLTIADVIARVCRTWGLRMYLTRAGLWALDFIGRQKAPIISFTEKHVKGFRQKSYASDTFAARVHFNYDYNFARPGNEYFLHTPDLTSAAEAANLAADIPFNLNQWFGRTIDGNAATPLSLATFFLAVMRENGNQVTVEVDISFFNQIDIGEVFNLTHWEGIGLTNGFEEVRIIVLHVQLTPSPASSRLLLTGYVDPAPVVASPSLSALMLFAGALVVEEVHAA